MATREPAASATTAATRVAEPPIVDATLAPPPIADIALPPELPRIEDEVESAEQFADHSIAVTWRVDADAAVVVQALVDAIIPPLALLIDERGAGGGVVAFEGSTGVSEEVTIAGHYLVTSVDRVTRVELRLDAPVALAGPGAPSEPVALPDGYPADVVPVFPGAVVTSTSAEALSSDAVRYVIAFETSRQAVEVIGFYRDVLFVAGWQLAVGEGVLDASDARGSMSLTVTGGARTLAVLQLVWSTP